MTDKLFGRDGDEWLQNDLATVYETWESDNDPADPEQRKPFVIIEWSAKPIGEFVQSVGRILERLYDYLCDDDIVLDPMDERVAKVFSNPDVEASFAVARAVLVNKLNATGWRNADREVKRHHITWDEAGEPLVDGEPLYRKASNDSTIGSE